MALTDSDKQSIQQLLSRDATAVELAIFDTMWSEHCSYKSSKPVLKTLPTDGPNILLGVGEDSGIIEFAKHNGHTYGIAVSHESHNHPSQVLPVEGAATGVGVVRDVLHADVIGVLDSLHFGVAPDDGYHFVITLPKTLIRAWPVMATHCVPNVGKPFVTNRITKTVWLMWRPLVWFATIKSSDQKCQPWPKPRRTS